MGVKRLVFLFMLISKLSIYANQIKLIELMGIFDDKSNFIKKQILDIKKLENEIRIFEINNFKGFSFFINSDLTYYFNEAEIPYKLQLENDKKNRVISINSGLSYKGLYLQSNYFDNDGNLEKKGSKIGYSKNIKDAIYSTFKYEKELLKNQKSKTIINNNILLKEKKVDITEKFFEALSMQNKILLYKYKLESCIEQVKIQNKLILANEGTKFELDIIEFNKIQLEKEIYFEERKLSEKKKSIFLLVGAKYIENTVFELPEMVNLKEVKKDHNLIEINRLENEYKQNEKEYYSIQNLPDLSFDLNYEKESDNLNVSLKFSTNLNKENIKKTSINSDISKLELDYIDLVNTATEEKNKLLITYEELLENEKIKRNIKEYSYEKYSIHKEYYLKGLIGLKKYQEETDEYIDNLAEYEEAVIKLRKFIYINNL